MSASDIWIRAGQKVFPGSFFPLFRRVYKVNLPAKKDKATMTPKNLLTIHRKPRSLVAPEQCSGGDLQRSWPLVLLALGCFALCPVMQAVVPVPDGAYPEGNTAEGQDALLSLTNGTYNTAVGWFSLPSVTDGKFNTGMGAGTLVDNTADNNTATGAGALLNNTTGDSNTATGAFALFSNTTGSANTVTGDSALSSNTTGFRNTATGAAALFSNTTGPANTAIGFGAH